MVTGYAIEPGPKATALLEVAEMRDGLDEDLLRRVFGVGAIPQHALGDVQDPGLVTANQLIQCLTVAVLGTSNKIRVRDVVVS